MQSGQRKVLVVDDDEASRMFVATIMAEEGWCVLEGQNGMEAIELAEEHRPDLIILDVVMPEMDGLEALRRLRANFFTKDIPVIMLTAVNHLEQVGYDEQKLEALLGVRRPEAFVDKPVDPFYLRDTVFGVVG